MRPLPEYERLHRQLEKYLPRRYGKKQFNQPQLPVSMTHNDPEIDALVALACHVQQVHTSFAQQLEERILSRHALFCQQQVAKKQASWFFSRSFRTSIVVAAALLCFLLGTSLLALAAPITNPSNPLYAVKNWEQHVQLSLALSPLDQAEVSLQIARDRLNTLASAQGDAYSQALTDLDGQVNTITQIIGSLPAGQDRNHLTDEFTTLKANARHVLRDSLPGLSLSERLITTDELRRLGDVVTQLNHAVITFSLRSSMQVTISLSGDNLYPGGHLLVNNTLIAGNGILHNGTYTFIVAWNSKQSPQTIGLLNADGTIAQTTAIILPNSGSNQNSSTNHAIQNIENKIQNRFGGNNDGGQSGKDEYNTGIDKNFTTQNGNNHNGNSSNANNYVHKNSQSGT